MAKRAYTSAVRARAAQETRAAILRAAAELFAEQGYGRATVAEVAHRAGVALNTVYTSVGGKPALIEAVASESAEDEAIASVLAEIQGLTDARQIMRRLAESTGEVTRRQSMVLRILLDNATDPAVATAADLVVRRYRERLTMVAEHLVALGAVSAGAERTGQILWFYFGASAWATVRDLGWEWAPAADWLADQATAALLASGDQP